MTKLGTIFGAVAALAGALLVGASACSPSVRLGEDAPREAGAPGFDLDASLDVAVSETLKYCPSSKCPAPLLTCPTSRFLCDIDPMTDIANCGGCGVACPESDPTTTYACSGGACVMKCVAGPDMFSHGNCDGLADNGCETPLGTADNCSACGDKCADGVPCTDGACGCPAPLVNCNGVCVDLDFSDSNCGSCGRSCDEPADAGSPPENAYYGCVQRQCGQLKCTAERPVYAYVDCNGDLKANPSDGCEVDILAQPNDEHCGGCGIRCTGDQHCILHGGYQCGCPPGMRDCGGGSCVAISTDIDNCGGCGRVCSAVSENRSLHATDSCNMGECAVLCVDGYANCNDNSDDGCEINLRSDPRHCGECGVQCDGVAGQACVDGHCIVEECGGVH